MANVDNLNFSVIINDADFDARCAAIEKRANELNTNLSNILQIDKVVGDSEAVKTLTEELGKTKKELADMISVNTEVAKAAEAAQKAAEAQAAEVDKLKKKLAELKKEGGSSDGDGSGMEALAQYHLDNAMAMEKENSYRKIGIELAKDADDVARQLKTDFAYLAEEEKQEAEDMKKSMALIKEYISLEKQVAKLENDLNVRKVSNKNADYTNAENKKLADHIAKQQKLRAELDKLIQRYPQLKAVFDQTFNTARLEAAVEAERRIARETERVTREKERQNKAIQAGIRHTANMTTEAKKLTMETGKVTKYWNQFKNVLGGATSIYAMKTILSNMMDITGEFELQRTTLRAILQDANKADVIFEKIKGLALVSPFNFKELISYTKQLSAFSIPANELYDTTKMLADLSAGLGVEMNRLILAFGQVRSAAFLRGQEVRQFTEAGIPLLEALRQEFERLGETGITTGQVFDKISNRLVPFQMVKNVLTEMTQEGGKFYNMQEVQSETLKGKLSNLKDAYQMMFNEIGESQSGLMKGTVDALREMMSNWEQVGKDIIALIAAFGLYKVAMASVNAVLKASVTAERLLATTQVASISAMSKKNLTMAVLNKTLINNIKQLRIVKAFSNPYALITAGVVALGFAMYKLITYQNSYEKTLSSIGKAQAKYNADLATERAKLDANLIKLRSLTEGTEEYEKLKSRLLLTYDEYLTDIEKETIKTQGLANSYEILSGAIANYNKEKFYTSEGNKIDETFSSMLEDTDKQIQKILTSKKNGIAAYYSKIVMDIVQGTKSIEDVSDKSIQNKLKGILFAENMQTGLSNFDKWKSAIDYAVNYSQEAKKKLDEAFSFYDTGNGEKTEVALQEYQKKVQAYYKNKFFPMIDKLTKEQEEKLSSQPFWASDVKNNEGGIAYAKTLKEQFDRITNDLKQSEMLSAQTVEDYKAQLVTIKEIDKIFNGAILRDTSEKKSGGKTEKNPYEDEIQALKLEYDLLKKVQSAYEDLRNAGFGNDKISKFFSETLGADFKGLDFASQIKTITDSLCELGEEGQKAADVIMNSAKKVDISEETKKMIDGVQQATERLKRLYDEFDSYIIEGNGITFDFSKILKESSKAITKIEAERKRSLEDLNTKKILLDEQAYQKEEKLIKNIYDTQIANQKKVTSEKIRELAKAIISDQNQKTSLDFMMNDISGQNIFQLGRLKEALADAKAEIDNYTTELIATGKQALLEKYSDGIPNQVLNQLLEDVDSAIEEARRRRQNDKDVTNEEYLKKWSDLVVKAAGKVKSFADSMYQLAEATGNVKLQNTMDALSSIASVVERAGQGAATGGWIGAIVGAVESIAEQTAAGIIKLQQSVAQTERSINSVAAAIESMKIDELLEGVKSLFGEDDLGNVNNYVQALKKVSSKYDELIKKARGNDIAFGNAGKLSTLMGGGSNEKAANWYADKIKKGYTELQAMMIQITDKNFFAKFWTGGDEFSTLYNLYPDLFKEDGSIDLSKLKEVYSSIKENGYMLSQEQEDFFEELIKNYEQYTEAMDGIKSAIESIFGTLSSDVADMWLDTWDEIGIISSDSASNIAKIFNDLGRSISKSLIQNVVLSPILSQFEEELMAIYKQYGETGNADTFISMLGSFSERLKEAIVQGTDSANLILQTLEDAGVYDRMMSSTDDTLKSSIQGITEETASRLANLINGIYAETFRQGGILDSMNINVAAILSKMNGSVSENTYQDYLMQIQANTYDTAQNTHKMLERIDSVMASTGGTGGQGIKVYLQN